MSTAIALPSPDALQPAPVLPADRHAPLVYLASLATGSRRSMHAALETIAALLTGGRCDASTLPWPSLRYQHTAAVRSALAERYAPATANRMLSALKGVLKAAWRLGQMPTDEYQRAIDIPSVRGETLPRGRALSPGELYALFAACSRDAGPGGARDAALFAVLYGGGLRRGEVVALDVADYDADSGALTVRSGKGNKARLSYISDGARDALAAWLRLRNVALGEAGPLFVPVFRSSRIVARRLNDQAVMDILLKRAREAGVRDLSPHDMRRTFISNLLDAGADLVTVQKLAGHANVTTTARYDRRGESVKRKAARLLHVPFLASGAAT